MTDAEQVLTDAKSWRALQSVLEWAIRVDFERGGSVRVWPTLSDYERYGSIMEVIDDGEEDQEVPQTPSGS